MDRLGDLRPVEQHVQFFLVSHGLSDDSKDVRNFTSPSPLESPEHAAHTYSCFCRKRTAAVTLSVPRCGRTLENLLSPAQDSDTHVRSVEFFCHSRARVWRARGIPNSAGGRGEGPGFFEQDRNCHY